MIVSDVHREFANSQLAKLASYDAQRPKNHVYEFDKHSERVARLTKALACAASYPHVMADALYWATLPHDIGKTALPVEIWDLKDKPTEEQRAIRRTHTIKGVDIVHDTFGDNFKDDPFLRLMTDIMTNHHECLDGSGFQGKTEADLSDEVKIVCICDAFDGWSVKRPHFGDRDVSPPAVIDRMRHEKAGQFDEKLLNLFEDIVVGEHKNEC